MKLINVTVTKCEKQYKKNTHELMNTIMGGGCTPRNHPAQKLSSYIYLNNRWREKLN